jgi:hypothetical protein
MHEQPEQPHRLFVDIATHCNWHWWMVLTFGWCFDVWSSRIGTNLSVARRGVPKKSASVVATTVVLGDVVCWCGCVVCAVPRICLCSAVRTLMPKTV